MICRCVKYLMTAACISVLLLLTSLLREVSGADVTIAPGQTCTSSACHDKFGMEKYVHPAMEDGDCSSCHEQQGGAHAFTSAADGDELCFMCHDQFDQKKNKHSALEEGCTSCHNPHQSETKFLLEADSLQGICFICHDESMVDQKLMHGPAGAGECTICHDPHESDSSKMLKQDLPGLCFVCHSEVQEELEKGKIVHESAREDCTQCHNPHGEAKEFFLADGIPDLCYTCHGDIEETVTSAVVKHGVVEKGKRCFNCHLPHSSDHDALLILATDEICYSCHDKQVDTPSGPIKDMKSWIKEKEYPHAPVADDECISCHNPHGSKYYRILQEAFPERFYSGFSEEAYALCFICHDAKFLRYEKTTKLTNFRNGAMNLHYLHVNKPRKGRKCTACHDVHASEDSKLINEKTLFGTWEMPIRFESTETGGSCSPGCHKYEAYDRENPIVGEQGDQPEG